MDYKTPQPSQSVFLIEVDKVKPNPLQPRKEFDQYALQGLAESVRQYGVLQPLVVVRKENVTDVGVAVEYELIAGERRLRAAQMAGLKQVPVIIREEPSDRVKLELALIENIQRKDLNPVERARAFKQLMDEFSLRHSDVGRLVGKSREWVSNSIRVLALPQDMQDAVADGRISEGHSRPLLMLSDHAEEQRKLFSDILYRNVSTRDAELGARRIAVERARKRDGIPDPVTHTLENRLAQVLGTRVVIERRGLGGKLSIEFFSEDDLRKLFSYIQYRPNTGYPVLARAEAPAQAAVHAEAVGFIDGETSVGAEPIMPETAPDTFADDAPAPVSETDGPQIPVQTPPSPVPESSGNDAAGSGPVTEAHMDDVSTPFQLSSEEGGNDTDAPTQTDSGEDAVRQFTI